ncbi:MAG TPA: winged helix-turn-helix domain-containing protein [Pyrinomonadaceae bacterium]|nr:winged helix-turn-helix domain-containing protein [Pyrinomonadaceae bacterium]
MGEQESNFYEFGRFRLDAGERVLRRDRELVPLTPKVFDILLALVERGGHLVEKDDLMKRVWPDTFVEEGNLTQNVSMLRKALGENPGSPQFIETVARRGYRFVAAVKAGEGALEFPGYTKIDSGSEDAPKPLVTELPKKNGHAAATAAELVAAAPAQPGIRNRILVFGLAAALIAVVGVVYFTGLGKAGSAAPIDSIAVLPFVDEAGGSDAQYLNDKIVDSLVNSLSKLPKLRVVPRSVVNNYRGKDIDPRQVGRELNVRAVVTGRVHRYGDTISIQADLIDVDNVAQIWGQLYDRKLADMLLVQEDISRDIFENLRLKLNVEEQKHLDAYRFYLKGRNAWNKRTADSLKQGVDFFQQSINTDPNYAPAYAGLADCYNMLVVYGASQPRDGFPKAKEAAIKALEIDENLAEAHSSLAFIKFRWDRDRVEAEREFLQAIKLKPNYAPAHQWYSSFLISLERVDEAIAEAKRTEELEPLAFTASSHLGWIYYLAGQSDRAIEQCTKILALDPNSFPARRYRGLAYEQKGMYREAIDEFQKGVKVSGSPLMLALLGHAYAASGQKSEAQRVLNELADLQNRRYVSSYTVGAIYAGLGDKDQAFKWLEKAYDERDVWLMNLKVDPVFAKIRSDKRFPDLLARAGLTP